MKVFRINETEIVAAPDIGAALHGYLEYSGHALLDISDATELEEESMDLPLVEYDEYGEFVHTGETIRSAALRCKMAGASFEFISGEE